MNNPLWKTACFKPGKLYIRSFQQSSYSISARLPKRLWGGNSAVQWPSFQMPASFTQDVMPTLPLNRFSDQAAAKIFIKLAWAIPGGQATVRCCKNLREL